MSLLICDKIEYFDEDIDRNCAILKYLPCLCPCYIKVLISTNNFNLPCWSTGCMLKWKNVLGACVCLSTSGPIDVQMQ